MLALCFNTQMAYPAHQDEPPRSEVVVPDEYIPPDAFIPPDAPLAERLQKLFYRADTGSLGVVNILQVTEEAHTEFQDHMNRLDVSIDEQYRRAHRKRLVGGLGNGCRYGAVLSALAIVAASVPEQEANPRAALFTTIVMTGSLGIHGLARSYVKAQPLREQWAAFRKSINGSPHLHKSISTSN